jgi:hypothetical protein
MNADERRLILPSWIVPAWPALFILIYPKGMNYRKFYLELISLLLSEAVTRKEVPEKMAMKVPIDKTYDEDTELLENCEWALGHAFEPNYYTTTREFEYYLLCLQGKEKFSLQERDRRIVSGSEEKWK